MRDEQEPVVPVVDQPLEGEMSEGSIEAEYTLEIDAKCPHCESQIDSVHLVRILRTRVNFVSSLPRRGQLMICPRCRAVLTGSLGGLI